MRFGMKGLYQGQKYIRRGLKVGHGDILLITFGPHIFNGMLPGGMVPDNL
jgi:hypothetical protein